jgi:hypothetical protein
MAGRNRCSAPGCGVLADRNQRVCRECWAKLPDSVQRVWVELTLYGHQGDVGAQKIRINLWRQLLAFWSGHPPNGLIWRGVDICSTP